MVQQRRQKKNLVNNEIHKEVNAINWEDFFFAFKPLGNFSAKLIHNN